MFKTGRKESIVSKWLLILFHNKLWVNSTCHRGLELTDVNRAAVYTDDVSFLGRMRQKFSTNQNFLYLKKIDIMQWQKTRIAANPQ